MKSIAAVSALLATLAAPALLAQAPPLITTIGPGPTISAGGTVINGPTGFTVTTGGSGGTYGGYGPYQTGEGGEFTLYSSDLAAAINNYYSGAQGQGNAAVGGAITAGEANFQTFCVEGNEWIYANTTSDVTRSGTSIYTEFPLSKGAAYLYSQFATGGNFGGNASYDYSNDGGRPASAAEMQDAIWALMGAQEGQTPGNNAGNPFLSAAIDEFGSFAAADAAGGADYDSVFILNLWDPSAVGTYAGAQQDQLIYWPTPDGGSTLALLGMGLSGLAILRRRR